jgi:plasmid stabilization system protein ParE
VSYSLSIRKEAEADIAEAYQYYESCRENLGSEFILCIEESISRIENNPRQYKTIYKNVHRALVRKFPYGIYYVLINEQIVILGVLHARKNPKHWQSRS